MNKFNLLVENVTNRFQRGGFLSGDIVKFKKDYKSSDWYKKQASNVQQAVDEAVTSGLNVRVCEVKAQHSNLRGGQGAAVTEVSPFFIDVVLEIAPGRWKNPLTVPSEMLELVYDGVNLPSVPDQLKRKDDSFIDPKELNTNEARFRDATKQTDASREGTQSLASKNTKLPFGKKWNDKKPGAGNGQNLPKNKKLK